MKSRSASKQNNLVVKSLFAKAHWYTPGVVLVMSMGGPDNTFLSITSLTAGYSSVIKARDYTCSKCDITVSAEERTEYIF